MENLTNTHYLDRIPTGDILTMIHQKGLEDENKCCIIDAHLDENLTYGDLFRKSHLIAQNLLQLGFQKGDTMGFYCENCIEFVLVQFAVLRLGGIFAGILPLLKRDELTRAINLSQCGYLLTSRNLVSDAIAVSGELNIKAIICLEGCEGATCISYQSLLMKETTLPDLSPSVSLSCDEDDPVCVTLLSSGTTGPFKAVALSSSNLLRAAIMTRLSGMSVLPGINFIPFTNAMGLGCLMGHLLHGEQLVFMKSFDANLYIRSVKRYQVESLTLVPSVVTSFINHPSIAIGDLSSVKLVTCTGAPLPAYMEQLICQKLKLPIDCVTQLLAMTEAGGPLTGTVPRWLFTGNSSSSVQFIIPRPVGSVGQVLPETQGKIIDVNHGGTLGPYEQGELLFKGKQIMVGYNNNSEATSQILDSEGWIHTGDMGYYDKNGFIFIVDRIKDIINCNAYQVSPTELEAVIMSKEGVADCAVVGVPDEEAGEAPIAFVVRKPTMHLSADNIKEIVADKLASFKRLKDVKFVEHIPKTATGKPLRRLLKEHL